MPALSQGNFAMPAPLASIAQILSYVAVPLIQTVALVQATETHVADWPVPAPGPDGAYPGCPCLRLTGNSSLDNLFPDLVRVDAGRTLVRRQNSPEVVPVDYGSSRCSDWDSSGYAYSTCVNQQRWCDYKWCFVDANSCNRRSADSVAFPGLTYSYETCGYLNRFLSPALQKLQGSSIFMAFLSVETLIR